MKYSIAQVTLLGELPELPINLLFHACVNKNLTIQPTHDRVAGIGCARYEEKHGAKKARKTWRKLHIALDSATGEIVATELTTEHVGDETALPDLLASIDADVAQFLADGAYDGQGVADCLLDEFGPQIEIIIPPPKKNAVHGAIIQRNRHINVIADHGRMKWQTKAGYNQRSRVEAQIGRWKQVIGDRLQARDFDNQTVETQIASKALNRMTALGRAAYERVF